MDSVQESGIIKKMEQYDSPSHECKAPEGGWGYVIIAAFVVMNWVSLIPTMIFTLLYGDHLASIGDETSQTALTLQVLLGLLALTSCFAGFGITRYGYRIIGLAGAISYSIGALGEHFGSSLAHVVIFTSVFKGIGFGLMETASITILNVYFDRRLNFAMGISQALIAIGSIVGPPQTTYLMHKIGIKNTIWVYTGLSLLNFPAMATFKTGRNNIRMSLVAPVPTNDITIATEDDSPKNELAGQKLLLQDDKIFDNGITTRIWIITKLWILDNLGFRLFSELKFWIISVGLAVAYISDILFYNLIRSILTSLNFSPEDVSLSMMLFLLTDVIGRVIYSVASRFSTFRNKSIFLTGSILINTGRIMYFYRDDYEWKMITIGIIGFLRAFVQTPVPLVVNESYKNNFPRAYSMYSVLSGIICLSFSSLTSVIKTYTGLDAMVIYVYAAINYLCCLIWFIYGFYCYAQKYNTLNSDS